MTPVGAFSHSQRRREQEHDETRARVRSLEEALARHFRAVGISERRRGVLVPLHDYGEAPWCAPGDLDGFWRALDAAIAAVAAEGPTITVSTYTITMLQKVTRRLAVELMAFNLREPAILRRYAEWVVEMLTTPARKLTPAQMARLRNQRARQRVGSTSNEAGSAMTSKLSTSSPNASPTFQQTSMEPEVPVGPPAALLEITTP